MSTAVTPVNANAPLQFHWDADDVNDQYYRYLHLNEVEKLNANETREFNSTVNNRVHPVTKEKPEYRVSDSIESSKPLTGDTRYEITLSKTENSTLPPILNAIEVYKVKDFSQSETQQDDGKLAH
jgi:hypothetical protein